MDSENYRKIFSRKNFLLFVTVAVVHLSLFPKPSEMADFMVKLSSSIKIINKKIISFIFYILIFVRFRLAAVEEISSPAAPANPFVAYSTIEHLVVMVSTTTVALCVPVAISTEADIVQQSVAETVTLSP